VDVTLRDKRLREEVNDSRRLKGRFGAAMAKVIRRRLDDLRAAPSLEIMRQLPGRCHELRADRAGQLSLDLRGPYRLLFVPAHDPLPQKPDGGLDWTQVTAVEIIEVEDTHG
jgi:plasmid maintenance system killer protein